MTLLVLLSLALNQGYAPTRQGTDPLGDPLLEARVQKLGKQLRCAVCQGVAISDSPASMAKAQLDKVRELVRDGKGDQEILDYFVARYGEWVLLEPTKGGLNAVLWAGPMVLLGLGLAFIVFSARRRRVPGVQPTQPTPPEEDDPFLSQVRADLEK